jgi:PAS domain S-box-containing protein
MMWNQYEDTGMNDPDRFVFEAPGSAGPQRIAAVAAAVPPERDAGGGLLEFGQRQLQDFEKSPRPMRIFERETCQYLAVNDAAVALYGYTREEFLTLTVKDTRHPDEHDELLESFDKPVGYLMHFEPRRHVKKSGEVFVAEVVTQDILFEGRRARVSLTIDVTERVRVLDLLRQREQEFEALAEHLPDPIARFDRNGRFLYVNSAVEKLTGASRSAILGRTQRELFMPDTVVELFERSLAEAARSGQAHTLEFSYPSASGNDRLFEAHHVPERDATGEIVTVLCVARDITERKKSEDDLRRQKNLFAAIVDNLPVGVFIRDAQTLRYVIRNRYCESTFAHFGESWVGKTVHDLFPKEYADRSVVTDRQALESGKMLEIPEWKALEGQIHHVRKVPLYGDNGEPWLVVGIADDITERKRTERDLRKNEEFLRRVIESSRDCIKVLELDGSIAWMSAGGQRLMEMDDVASVLGRSYVDFWSGTDRESALAALATARAGDASRFEGYCPSAKGTPRWWDEIATPILGADGTPERLLVVSRDITESKKAEQTLRDSEARLALIVENVALGMWDWNVRTGEMWRHPRWAQILGYRPEDVPGHISVERELCHPDDWARAQESLLAHFDGKTPLYETKHRMRDKTGAWIWVRCRGKVIERGGDGSPVRMIGYIRDITERKRIEDALHESREQFRAVTETANDAIVSADSTGRIVHFNQAASRTFGYGIEEAVGQPLTLLMPARFQAAHLAGLRRFMAGGAPNVVGKTIERTGRRKDGTEFPLELSLASWRTNGSVFFTGILRDITQRKESEHALRESEERFRQLAENIREVFWVNSQAGDNMVYVSPAYEEIWGRSCESLYRNPHGWMEPIHPEDLPAVRGVQKRMSGGEHTDVEYRIIRPDGALRWIRDRSYPMKRGDGAPLVCGIAEDITDQKRAEEERLTHAIHQRDALVREVHHRIKNHLQGIAGLLRNKAADDPAATDTIEAAVAQLQSVAVVYGLQSELAESGVPLCRVLDAICSSAEGLSGARVVRAFAADTGSIRLAATEAVPVAVALNELVFNAIEHGVRRGRTPRIEVALTEKKDGADIRIVNRGKLSARFDYSRGIGTGTGLDLVKTLLGPSGGKLQFGSREGRVEVNLSLRPPLVAARKRQAPAAESHPGK